jgi:hypothetical protein
VIDIEDVEAFEEEVVKVSRSVGGSFYYNAIGNRYSELYDIYVAY